MSIRYTKDFNKEITRIVENYNRRLQRAIDKMPFVEKEVDFVKVSDLKAEYTDKRKLQSKLNSLKRFTAESAEVIKTASGKHTKYAIKELSIKRGVATRKLKAEISRIGGSIPTIGGKSVGFTRLQMGDPKLDRLIAKLENISGFKSTKELTESQFNSLNSLVKLYSHSESQRKFENFRKNFLQDISDSALSEMPEIGEFINFVEGMSKQEFEDWYESELGASDVLEAYFKIMSPNEQLTPIQKEQSFSGLREKIVSVIR